GMLSSAEIIGTVASAVHDHGLRLLVVDPVMVAKGGARLLREDAVAALRSRLLPLAAVMTPNLPEAEVLLELEPGSLEAAGAIEVRRHAAVALRDLGAAAVVLKGGHAAREEESVDLFYDGRELVELRARRVPTGNTHGSGCVFSAAITAELSKGRDVAQAVATAKAFIQSAIAASFELGHGHGPVNPLHSLP